MEYDIYLASPLFSDEDNRQLDIIEDKLEKIGLEIFSPRHHSQFNIKECKTKEEIDNVAKKILESNLDAINNSKLVLANTKGIRWDNAIYSDGGTLFEIGYATGKYTPVVTFNFDNYGLNIMLSQTVVTHINNLNTNINRIDMIRKIIDDIYTGYLSTYELRLKYYEIIEEQI